MEDAPQSSAEIPGFIEQNDNSPILLPFSGLLLRKVISTEQSSQICVVLSPLFFENVTENPIAGIHAISETFPFYLDKLRVYQSSKLRILQ